MEYFHWRACLAVCLCSLPAPAHLLTSWTWETGESPWFLSNNWKHQCIINILILNPKHSSCWEENWFYPRWNQDNYFFYSFIHVFLFVWSFNIPCLDVTFSVVPGIDFKSMDCSIQWSLMKTMAPNELQWLPLSSQISLPSPHPFSFTVYAILFPGMTGPWVSFETRLTRPCCKLPQEGHKILNLKSQLPLEYERLTSKTEETQCS